MKILSEGDIDMLAAGAQLLAVLATWNELGVWRALAEHDGPMTLAEISKDWPGGSRGLELTVPIMAHAGLVEGAGTTWTMTDTARELHRSGRFSIAHHLARMDDLGRLPATVLSGGPARDASGKSQVTRGGVVAEDRDATRRFLDMLYRRSEETSKRVLTWTMPRVRAGGHVLDLGGGHGRYARAFASRGMEVTLFDQPVVVELARERHGDALHHYRAGDFHRDDLGGPYDVALLSNIVHSESRQDNAALVERLYQALRPGGLLVLSDMFIDEQGADPDRAVFFGLVMLSYTENGCSYGLTEVARWLDSAGFRAPEYVASGGYTLVFANKPG